MNNGLKPSKVTVSIELMPSFSASIAQMRISPVTRVIMSMPQAVQNGKIELSIVGKCGDVEFLKRADFVKEYLDVQAFNFKNGSSCVFEFDFDSFEYDNAFLNSLEHEFEAELYVLATVNGVEYMSKSSISLLPANMWLGLEGEPSVVASFVKEDKTVDEICLAICENDKISYSSGSKKSRMAVVKELYKRLKSCNIIYTRPVGYAANIKQIIRSANELFGSSSVLATPLEIAAVFVSCAKKAGFDTSLLFVRGRKGDISVLCGVYLVKSSIDVPVCEDAEKIKALIEAGDLLVVDPSVFAAAQNTSFIMSLENAAEEFCANSHNLVCMVEIECAKLVSDRTDTDECEGLPCKNAIAQIYTSLVSSPVMQLLSGNKRNEIEDIPLLLTDFNAFFEDTESIYKLLPLDFSVELEDFAAIDKNFSSILTMSSPKANQHFSRNELERIKERFLKFKEKITVDGEITTAHRDEALYRVASSMAFGKNKKQPYFAFGYVKITDKLTEMVSFAPICLVRAKVTYSDGNFYVKQTGLPTVNKVFIRNALKDSLLGYDSFMKSLMPTDKEEIFDLFENIRLALTETDDRHVYEIVKEAHIINIDIDDYVLWSNLALVRKKMSRSEMVASVFGEKELLSDKADEEYIPSKAMYSEGMKAAKDNSSFIVEGAFTKEKEDVLSAIAGKNITFGKSTLVVTDDVEMSQYVYNVLAENGLSEMAFIVDESENAYEAAKKISDNVEKYKDLNDDKSAFINPELYDINATLLDYTDRINKSHSMGMSLKEAVIAYLSASSGVSGCDDIPVDKSIFEYADESKLGNIFERVGELITIAGNLCKKSGLEVHTPLKNHPLFNTNPRDDLDNESKKVLREAIDSAIPVLSEYRDVFLDVNEILGFNEQDIDSLYKLEKLNDLYKLVLTARDVDIPEKFVESDIADFSRSKRFENENKKRMQAIEFKLNFFSHEIFEDVESILRGDEYEDDYDKGFLKKFMHKKNYQEILLQYVPSDKKSEFQQHKISDIYKMLYEYKSCIVSLRQSASENDEMSENAKLAKISEKASYLVEEISSGAYNSKKLLSNVFRLISVIPVDASLARKITVVRARMAELYSGENSICDILTAGLGIDFNNLVFNTGILSFDGLGKYLEEVENKLELTEMWSLWLRKAKAAREFVPGFVKHLENYGVGTNVDRIFAKSLLAPIAECVGLDSFSGFSYEKLGKGKDKYANLLQKACDVSANNVIEAYKKTVKHISETYSINPDDYVKVPFKELVVQNAVMLQKTLPVVIVTKNMLTGLFPFETVFDTVCVLDNKDNGFTMLPAFAYGNRVVVFNMSHSLRSKLCNRFAKYAHVYNVSKLSSSKDAYLFSWINSRAFEGQYMMSGGNEKSSVELVRMNGTYERTTTRTNRTEAELAIVKAANLLQETSGTVVVTAFTKEQCTAIEKMIAVLSKKNKILLDGKNEGRIYVSTPDRLYMRKYDSLVVCSCFGTDKDARLGWDFGYASICGNEKVPEAYISIADRKTEKTYILTSFNVKDSRFVRRTGKNASVFNSLCDILSEGRIPVDIVRTDKQKEDSILAEIMSCVEQRNPRVMLCEGKVPLNFALMGKNDNRVYILCDNDKGVSLHDQLVVKKELEDIGMSVTTLNPMSLTGENFDETMSGFVKNKD